MHYFDAIPHALLLRKLQSLGFSDNILKLYDSYLHNRSLRVRVNSAYSGWSETGIINSGVPQGSILGPLLFLLYINDIHEVVKHCSLYLYADDSCLFLPVGKDDDIQIVQTLLQSDLERMTIWADKWKMTFKAGKCTEIIFVSGRQRQRIHPNVFIKSDMIPRVSHHKHLGLILDEKLSFESHINYITTKCNNLLNPLKMLSGLLGSKHLETIYNLFVLPHLEYGSIIFDCANHNNLVKLDRIHYRAALLVSGCIHGSNSNKVLKCLAWLDLNKRRNEKKACLMFDNENNQTPIFIREIIDQYRTPPPQRVTRHHRNFIIPTNLSRAFMRTTIPSSIKLWESLPENIKNRFSRNSFKYNLRKHFRGDIVTTQLTKNLTLTRSQEKILNRTRCDLVFNSHFFSHNFTTIDSPSCRCGMNAQNTNHVLFNCPLLADLRAELMNNLNNLDPFFSTTFQLSQTAIKSKILLFGSDQLSHIVNRSLLILTATFLELSASRI